MQNDAGPFVNGLRRWRERRRAETQPFVDAKDRRYELWACAMAPELVSLAALMVLAEEDDASARDRPRPWAWRRS